MNGIDPSGNQLTQWDTFLWLRGWHEEDHHWFPQFGRGPSRRGQRMLEDRFPHLGVNIDHYTTTYVAGDRDTPHSYIHRSDGLDYNNYYKTRLLTLPDQCIFMIAMATTMR